MSNMKVTFLWLEINMVLFFSDQNATLPLMFE